MLPGEEKERTFERVDLRRQETALETSEAKFDERDLQRTDRSQLHDQTSSQTELSAHVEASVDVSAQYGPAKIDAHVGGSLDYSTKQSNEHALTLSQEIVSRAVTRIEQRVSENRKTFIEEKSTETTRHAFKNADSTPVTGIYRWLDRIDRARVVSYPNRYLMEFEVPEPAAWYRWAHQADTARGLANAAPIPLTLSGAPEDHDTPRLTARDITAENYLALGARYMTPGLQAPPGKQITAALIRHDAPPEQQMEAAFRNLLKGDATLTVPAGWMARSWRASVMSMTDSHANPLPATLLISVGAGKAVTIHFSPSGKPGSEASLHLGPITTQLHSDGSVSDMGPITSGTVPVSIVSNNLNGMLVNIELLCVPLSETLVAWRSRPMSGSRPPTPR